LNRSKLGGGAFWNFDFAMTFCRLIPTKEYTNNTNIIRGTTSEGAIGESPACNFRITSKDTLLPILPRRQKQARPDTAHRLLIADDIPNAIASQDKKFITSSSTFLLFKLILGDVGVSDD